MNKIDLVPKKVVADWLTYLRRSHPTITIKASQERGNAEEVQVDANSTSVPVGMDGLLQLLKNYSRTGGLGGKTKTTIVVGILGYPVGFGECVCLFAVLLCISHPSSIYFRTWERAASSML